MGCVLAATSVYLAAAGVAQPEHLGQAGEGAEPGPGLQGWGKIVHQHSNQLNDRSVGVWAVEQPKALEDMRARLNESFDPVPGGLALRPITALTVVVKGKAHDVMTNAATVGELLSAMRIEPDRDDRVVPPPSTPLSSRSRVTYTSIKVKTLSTIKPEPMGPVTVATPRLAEGQTQMVFSGKAGRVLRVWRIRVVNGTRVARHLVFSRVLTPARPGRRLVGTARDSLQGEASWYYIDTGLTAASPWLPFGTEVTVTNLDTGAVVTVVINDRGPFGGRIIDLSEEAFSRIAPLGQGVADVRITW